VIVRSATVPALVGVTSWQVPGAVTVVGAHQSVPDREIEVALLGDGGAVLERRGDDADVSSDASAENKRVEEQRLADPRSCTTYVDESEV